MAKSSSSSKRGSSFFSGLLVGAIISVLLAVAVVLWINSINPFRLFDSSGESTPPAATSTAPEPAPDLDFYKVLPGKTPDTLPEPEPATAAPVLHIQVGAFQSPEDADNLKAQLALLGLEANIQTTETADHGTLHRVRIGPLASSAEADHIRALLKQNQLPAQLVRETPAPEEKP